MVDAYTHGETGMLIRAAGEWVRAADYEEATLRLEGSRQQVALIQSQLAALELAAWDAYEAVMESFDSDEYVIPKSLRKALSELGELLPAQRPTHTVTVDGGEK